jgi:hypothetical protein
MVLSILLALAAIPGVLAAQEGVREGQKKKKAEANRGQRCHLIANCLRTSRRSKEINGQQVVLKNGKVYIFLIAIQILLEIDSFFSCSSILLDRLMMSLCIHSRAIIFHIQMQDMKDSLQQ